VAEVNQDPNYLYNNIYTEGYADNGAQRYLNPATFNSFSGTNIIAIFNTRVITEVQAITYSVKREIAPVYTFGTAVPLSFSSGKRGIAGSVVTVVFDRESLLSEMVGEWGNDNPDEVRTKIFGSVTQFGLNQGQYTIDADGVATATPPDISNIGNELVNEGVTDYGGAVAKAITNFGGVDQFNATLNTALGGDYGNLNKLYVKSRGFGVGGMLYADQIPPFNITISMLNETGRGAQLDILGVKIMN